MVYKMKTINKNDTLDERIKKLEDYLLYGDHDTFVQYKLEEELHRLQLKKQG